MLFQDRDCEQGYFEVAENEGIQVGPSCSTSFHVTRKEHYGWAAARIAAMFVRANVYRCTVDPLPQLRPDHADR